MRLLITTTLLALVSLASAQGDVNGIPACAVQCFTQAVSETTCSIFDYYCQCTTGAQQISSAALPCICNNSDCSAEDLIQVTKAKDTICSAAFAASDRTYTPTPLPANFCAASGTGGNSTTAGANPAASSSSAGSSATPEANAAKHVGVQGALLGFGALAVLIL